MSSQTKEAQRGGRLRWLGSRRVLLGAVALLVAGAGVGLVMSATRSRGPVFPTPVPSDRFDGALALEYLEKICEIGPRISATPGMRTQQEVLRRHFEALGATVERQSVKATQPSKRGRKFRLVNLVVHWHPQAKRRVLLGAHYDTRPIADREPVARDWKKPFLGANDGASGVAFLMELGRRIPKLDLKVGVDFVFFDAEEYIFVPNYDKFFLGSEYFVRRYVRDKPDYRYEAVVVVDMIGDRDLEILPDQRSLQHAEGLVSEIWGIAGELGVRQFVLQRGPDILDDHVAFQDAGIPAIDLIDFEYPHWHRLSDTPDKCSAESLDAVGRVLLEWLARKR